MFIYSDYFIFFFFFFNDTATTEIYTLSLHDALPIWWCSARRRPGSSGGSKFGWEVADGKPVTAPDAEVAAPRDHGGGGAAVRHAHVQRRAHGDRPEVGSGVVAHRPGAVRAS